MMAAPRLTPWNTPILTAYSNGTCPVTSSGDFVYRLPIYGAPAVCTGYLPSLPLGSEIAGLFQPFPFHDLIQNIHFCRILFKLSLVPLTPFLTSPVPESGTLRGQANERERERPTAGHTSLLSSTPARSTIDSIGRLMKQSGTDNVRKAGTFSTQTDTTQDSGVTDVGAVTLGHITG